MQTPDGVNQPYIPDKDRSIVPCFLKLTPLLLEAVRPLFDEVSGRHGEV
jgi:hypothetical protein